MRLGDLIFFSKEERHSLYMNNVRPYQKNKIIIFIIFSVSNVFKDKAYNH